MLRQSNCITTKNSIRSIAMKITKEKNNKMKEKIQILFKKSTGLRMYARKY